ncbi:MAG: hypothetical protein A3J79_13625 [Elusimicrobia bacterium RIFOXYB2_FULL_62_6]|nr:MAG: hypothetical protein A3J79_13625 [Elusimicrobia bacterium RIFOXYB2_FULL_62_6]
MSIQNQMLLLFADLRKKLSLSFIFISHDILATAAIADSIAVMKEGSIVECGNPEQILSAPAHPYTQRPIAALPLPPAPPAAAGTNEGAYTYEG